MSNAASNPAATAWNAALDAVRTAPAVQRDQALTAMMQIENAIDAAPVDSMANAVLRLRLALTMAERQGVEDDPAWRAVGGALAFLADRA